MRSRALTLPPSRMAVIPCPPQPRQLGQQRFAAFGAAQHVDLAEDGDFNLLHGAHGPAPLPASAGRRSSNASMRARAAARRERRLSRSAVTAMQLLFDQGAGALELLVAQHQAVHAFSEVVELGHVTGSPSAAL
jgi:hypothetical protein